MLSSAVRRFYTYAPRHRLNNVFEYPGRALIASTSTTPPAISCCLRQSVLRSASSTASSSTSDRHDYHHPDSTHGFASLLKDPSLLTPYAKLDHVHNHDYFPVYDPAQPTCVLAQVPNMNSDQTRHAIETSSNALIAWRDQTTASHRSQLLLQWSRLLHEHKDDLAIIMTLESGKPLQESYGEISYGASYLDFYAAEALRPNSAGGGFIVPTPFSTTVAATNQAEAPPAQPRGHVFAWQQAVGVTALISPWNFPLAMITRKVGPALAVGCTALVKPSDRTPLTTVALHTLGQRAGIPPDVLQLM